MEKLLQKLTNYKPTQSTTNDLVYKHGDEGITESLAEADFLYIDE